MEVVILIGVQASGKTTFHRRFLKGTHDHVSMDDFPNAKNRRERMLRLIRESLARGRSVAVDNTNPTREDRAGIIHAAKEFSAEVSACLFEPDVEESCRRNAARSDKRPVPERAVRITAARLERPAFDEGFDKILSVRLQKDNDYQIEELPRET